MKTNTKYKVILSHEVVEFLRTLNVKAVKKTQKTPQKEIEKAERKRKEYFENN